MQCCEMLGWIPSRYWEVQGGEAASKAFQSDMVVGSPIKTAKDGKGKAPGGF